MKNKTNGNGLGILWSLFFTNFIIFLYFEKGVFDEYIRSNADYLLLLVFLLLGFVFSIIISNKASQNTIKIILFILSNILTIFWFLILIYSPIEQNNVGCNLFTCEKWGQFFLIISNVAILPILLFQYSKNTNQFNRDLPNSDYNFVGIIVLLSGFSLLLMGLIALISYYFVYILTTLYSFILSLKLLFDKNISIDYLNNGIEEKNLSIPKESAEIDILYSFFEILFILLITIMAFSTLENREFSYNILLEFGIGLILLSIADMMIKSNKTPKIEVFSIFSIIVLILFIVASSITLQYLLSGMEIELKIGLPAILMGLCFGYIVYIIESLLNNTPLLKEKTMKIPKITIIFGQKFTLFFYFSIITVGTIISISPNGSDGYIIFLVVLVVSVVELFFWFGRIKKKFKNSNGIIETI